MSESNTFTFVEDAAGMAEYEPGRVKPVSVLKSTGANVVIFAFDKGAELREHTAHQPAILQALEGSLAVTVAGVELTLKPGDLLHLEPHVPHSVSAAERARLQLTVLMIDSPGPVAGPTGRVERSGMTTRILLVRAVNVGGAKLPMAEFRELLSALGGENVRTYIASGNAVLEVVGDSVAFDRAVEKALTERYGYVREVISRTPNELQAALDRHPFEVAAPKYSYVAPLTAAPGAEAIERAREVPTGDDRWEVIGDALHIRYANGAGRAELDMNKVLKRLGVQGTARNLNTVQKLIEMAEA